MSMITCPNCGDDHEIQGYHVAMKDFNMTCNNSLCGVTFSVDIEIIAHTRTFTTSQSDGKGDDHATQAIP